MTAPNQRFLSLFDLEVQNRAFAYMGVEALGKRAVSDLDKAIFADWLAFEAFLQRAYAPMAKKYGVSQELRWQARLQARLATLGAAILPDRFLTKITLNGTEKHLEKMHDLYKAAPDEDKEFFDFVVRQEQVQVDSLKLRLEGKKRDAARLLADFTSRHQGDFPQDPTTDGTA
ncbi:MAG: hypothetical protein AAFY42_11555 [Pseudomonadota bacterium]